MPCKINNTSNFDVSEIEDLIQDLFSFSQDRFGFQDSPVLNLVSDEQNTSPLGKTAHYDPNSMEITIYVDGRHPKDIMRSFSHELVHHNQNENGQFANIVGQGGSNYAQTNPHLRKMEKEAYLKGNMCFRDWEDGYKSSNPNILNERRIYKMSIKDWKDKELNGLLNERWGFSMDLSKLNESKKKPDADGDGVPDWADKKPGKDDHAEKDAEDKPKKKAKKGEIPPQLKQHVKGKKKDKGEDKKKIEEAEEKMTIGQRLQQVTALRDALRKGIQQDMGVNIPAEKMEALIDMVIDAAARDEKARALGYQKFSKMPPQGGGNDDGGQGGAPAQVQEQKLRKAVRKILKEKLNKKK